MAADDCVSCWALPVYENVEKSRVSKDNVTDLMTQGLWWHEDANRNALKANQGVFQCLTCLFFAPQRACMPIPKR